MNFKIVKKIDIFNIYFFYLIIESETILVFQYHPEVLKDYDIFIIKKLQNI